MGSDRKYERIPYQTDIKIKYEDLELLGISRNISRGGVYIIISEEIPFGSKVELNFRLPKIAGEVSINATVRWLNQIEGEGFGLGVQFGNLRPIEVWALNNLVRKPS